MLHHQHADIMRETRRGKKREMLRNHVEWIEPPDRAASVQRIIFCLLHIYNEIGQGETGGARPDAASPAAFLLKRWGRYCAQKIV
jgi:hypothetical protein